jgi:hypothetical protein
MRRTRARKRAPLFELYGAPPKFAAIFTRVAVGCHRVLANEQARTLDALSNSTLFWIMVAAAFIVAELGVILILVRLSVRPMRRRP